MLKDFEKLQEHAPLMDQGDIAAYQAAKATLHKSGSSFFDIFSAAANAVPPDAIEKMAADNTKMREENQAHLVKQEAYKKSIGQKTKKLASIQKWDNKKGTIGIVAAALSAAMLFFGSVRRNVLDTKLAEKARERQHAEAEAAKQRRAALADSTEKAIAAHIVYERNMAVSNLDGKNLVAFRNLSECITAGNKYEDCVCSRDKAFSWRPDGSTRKFSPMEQDSVAHSYRGWITVAGDICDKSYPLKPANGISTGVLLDDQTMYRFTYPDGGDSTQHRSLKGDRFLRVYF